MNLMRMTVNNSMKSLNKINEETVQFFKSIYAGFKYIYTFGV